MNGSQSGILELLQGFVLPGPVRKARQMTDLVSGLFELPAKIAVERGLAEFRAGRPVRFDAEDPVIAVPVDALDRGRLQSFIETFAKIFTGEYFK